MGTAAPTLGLFAAWVAHDIEEWLTAAPNSTRILREAPDWLPIPDRVRRDGVSQEQINVALAMMAALFAAGSLDGWRTGGRSWLYRLLLDGFGLHTFSHVGLALVRRRYASGVVTAPLVALPFWWWARRELRRSGVDYPVSRLAMPLFVPLGLVVHGIALRLTTGKPEIINARG
ncbi:HXXEE domain-containing protein [Ammonicoccus fulvus]|uniref:HXXEE domain-containing protein n=1 Tax=Ammonicoccus fulvus TaxID=3138240 RepID=A0ABZ3FRR5_9ACTN